MIPKSSFAYLKIPKGRFLGLLPLHHKVVVFLDFDQQPEREANKAVHACDMTLAIDGMLAGGLCDCDAKIDWDSETIRIDELSKGIFLEVCFQSQRMEGHLTLRHIGSASFEHQPICFRKDSEGSA